MSFKTTDIRSIIAPSKRVVTVRKVESDGDVKEAETEKSVVLDTVFGLTAGTNASLSCNAVTGVVAYPAGCVTVLFNPLTGAQDFIHNTLRKTISCLSFSKDGKYLVIGESGHKPSVRAWSIDEPGYPQISEMANGHKHGVACVAFAPDLKHVVSAGFQHDLLVNMWNLKSGKIVACNKVSTKIYGICFSESASFFVTCGVRHLKFWYFEEALNKPKDNSQQNSKIPLSGRSALLGKERYSAFCDVVCGIGKTADYTYSVTSNGKLCAFGASRSLEKSFELRASRALCLAVSEQFICCGCTNGIVRVCDPVTLEIIRTLPRPHFLGVDVGKAVDGSCEDEKESDLYPDAIALSMDPKHNKVTCLYNDRSLYVWEMLDIDKIVKSFSSLYHSSGIWGIKAAVKLAELNGSTSPYGTFLTCSSDDTVRFWDMDRGAVNPLSKELSRVLYIDPCYTNLKKTDNLLTSKNVRQASKEDQRRGIKTVAISAGGKLLAVGDKIGNVRIYDTVHMKERYKISAHESEVLCVEFSPLKSGYNLLVSAGRDRLIHVYNASEDFTLLQTLDDHSASIASIKFHVHSNGEFQLLSCGADRTIYFRVARKETQLMFVRTTNVVNKTGLRDMAIDCSRNLAAVACQDRTIRIYDSSSGKHVKTFKGSKSNDGTLTKITIDRSGCYAVTSCSDKTLSFLDLDSGECVATLSGHSEQSTDMLFSSDCSRLITVSADGCIFIWRLPLECTQNMITRHAQMGIQCPAGPIILNHSASEPHDLKILESITTGGATAETSVNGKNTQAERLMNGEISKITETQDRHVQEDARNSNLEKQDFVVQNVVPTIMESGNLRPRKPSSTTANLTSDGNEVIPESANVERDFQEPNIKQESSTNDFQETNIEQANSTSDFQESNFEQVNSTSDIQKSSKSTNVITEFKEPSTKPEKSTGVDNIDDHKPNAEYKERDFAPLEFVPNDQVQEHFIDNSHSTSETQENTTTLEVSAETSSFRFSIGQLPTWARYRIVSQGNGQASSSTKPRSAVTSPTQPVGRWAERLNSTATASEHGPPNTPISENTEKKTLQTQPEPLKQTNKSKKSPKKAKASSKSSKHSKCSVA
ncbi:mitogen-activated protein kinase-binding protein 1 [Nematostella vectensis]|uniref:mitogen-activated protein kinase-binding protein 1 n=1 Tax=Nematostella vectensis TaxID=45351 RepID=UPI0020777716|nr:mitogen-activated protein kinase-binding protein 1 [Nematostella vectensis]